MSVYPTVQSDSDPIETAEWIESLDAVLDFQGPNRARFLLARLLARARAGGFVPDQLLSSDYVNTIPRRHEPAFPGDLALEDRINDIVRWNAAVMVTRANLKHDGLGGHISTFASSADLYDVGFNHFFQGRDENRSGDQIFFQGHASPGIYARAFLEGRISESQMNNFRQETDRGAGLSSYPHPRLMPEFWEFPTVSMGIGPLNSIYQARFNRYLEARGICDTSNSRVWCFVGDGETDEPETLGALSVAAREGLDNLTWVVNCNLQRLDGPVRGNGKIVQELETVFRGAGWNVLKVLWGSEWDDLLERDSEALLRRRMNEVVDGELQKYRSKDGAYIRQHFFGADPRLLDLVSHMSDDEIWAMRRGGHDPKKVYAAYRAAVDHRGRPTVILAQTIKGFTLGEGFESKNVTHQIKKMTRSDLEGFRNRLELPITDDQLEDPPYFHPGAESEEVQYMLARRKALGGFVPTRNATFTVDFDPPPADVYEEFYAGTKNPGGVSTTMAFVRLLTKLLKDKGIGNRIVPIIPDEARTFGMEPLFRSVGIYSSKGQLYEPVDREQLLYYRESKDGQVLEEGITEAGSMASFTAAGTSYATHGQPMLPFYIFYSMFGFQRIGDLAWAFADMRGRGFLMGATAGRTTLNGEGLQHEDGHSHVLAMSFPNLLSYDPAFAYEIALIVKEGIRRMVEEDQDVFYYLTIQNENYPQPPMPEGVEEGVVNGLYRYREADTDHPLKVQIFGSGVMMNEALRAQEMLGADFGVSADVWSVTSYQRLRHDALTVSRWNMLHPEAKEPKRSYIARTLEGVEGPFVAVSDYLTLVPDQIRRWLPGTLVSLGTDGFGMSDTREALRRHFEVDAESIVIGVMHALKKDGHVDPKAVSKAIQSLGYDPDKLRATSI